MEFSKCLLEKVNKRQEVKFTLSVFLLYPGSYHDIPTLPLLSSDNNGSAVAVVSEGYSLYQDAF